MTQNSSKPINRHLKPNNHSNSSRAFSDIYSFQPQVSRRTVFLVALLTTIASSVTTAAIVRTFFSGKNSEVKSSTASIEQHSIDSLDNVSASGRIEPEGEAINLSAPAFLEGARIERLLVKLGERVKAGQTIAILDSRERAEAALQRTQARVEIARSRLAQVEAGAKLGTIQAQKITIERLEAELVGQMATQTATIERVRSELDNARIDCNRYQRLYRDGAVAAADRDVKCLKEKTFARKLQEVRATRDRTKETSLKQIAEARSTLEAISEVRPVDVSVARAELAESLASVRQARADLNLAYVRAPQDSQILKIYTFPGELVGQKGIVLLGKTDRMYAIAEVYETDIAKVKIGRSATITSKGLKEKLRGTVVEVGLQIGKKDVLSNDPVADVDARVVEVKIQLDRTSSQIVSHLTNLEVEILIEIDSPQVS